MKPGQTAKQRFDNLRKALTRHVDHVADKMAEARAEEAEHTDELKDIADEIIKILRDNTVDARLCAQRSNKAQDFMFSSNAASHVLNFISKLKPKEESEDKPGIERAIEAMKERRDGKL